ncbi:hypothetical protein HYPSUDRAFT_473721 [Hypholoma sublateritium FD-334 SS-4]|uniref:Uncharacterized protein n=1 Tax=Hypholoma sublateritium (strain FD-334 SS-4) TaxID=945553 RepID=A0A0D2PYT5_HYPSF|nr:hypothetical protein HYPSUDRAFT_473721 [Hypholoma sublateritium FD-334 SS-4]
MLSGRLPGTSGQLESSHMVNICAMGDVQSLDASQTEVGNENPHSNHGAIQIAPPDPDTMQETDNSDRTFRPRFDALNLPCQAVIQKFNSVEMTDDSSIEKSELSSTRASLMGIMSQTLPSMNSRTRKSPKIFCLNPVNLPYLALILISLKLTVLRSNALKLLQLMATLPQDFTTMIVLPVYLAFSVRAHIRT